MEIEEEIENSAREPKTSYSLCTVRMCGNVNSANIYPAFVEVQTYCGKSGRL